VAPSTSVVIPARNEETTVAAVVRAALAAAVDEVVVVDDGSTDATADLVRGYAERDGRVSLVGDAVNRGKGYAIKTGLAAARGDWVLFTDADLSVPFDELPRFIDALAGGADVAIGSRRMAGARLEKRQPWLRESMGSAFRFLTRRLLVGGEITDVTCGFKAFTRDAARFLSSHQTLWDWSFDAELLFVARKHGLKIENVPVRWRHDEGTKVHMLRDAARALRGLVTIRMNDLKGVYGRRPDRQRSL
jgi:glycosyltransferase involved in cell wall biosynthesis